MKRLYDLTRVGLLIATLSASSLAQSGDSPTKPRFAAPVRLKAGDMFLGENRLYPSPVFHDVNGDGKKDIVVGDLVGHLTVAYGEGEGRELKYSKETRIKAADGEDLKFHNW